MENVINEIFSSAYQIKIESDGLTLEKKGSKIPAAIVIDWMSQAESIKLRKGFMALMRFDEVETILQPVLEEYQINKGLWGNWPSTINRIFEYSDINVSINKNSREVDINNKDALREFFTNVKEGLKLVEKEFFNKFSSLKDVYEYMPSLDEEELSEFISNPVLLREMVIKVLCDDNTDIDDLANSVMDEYNESEQYNHSDATQDLSEVLKNV